MVLNDRRTLLCLRIDLPDLSIVRRCPLPVLTSPIFAFHTDPDEGPYHQNCYRTYARSTREALEQAINKDPGAAIHYNVLVSEQLA